MIRKRFLVLSFYYPPDLGPGSLRAQSIVDGLCNGIDGPFEITIFTTSPNRCSYTESVPPSYGESEFVKIHRVLLSPKSGEKSQLIKSFVRYALFVREQTSGKTWDVVISTSGRLMTAVLSAWVARRCHAKLYLDIRDLFTEALEGVRIQTPTKLVVPIFRFLERLTLKRADKVNVISPAFYSHVRSIVPLTPISAYTNGVDREFIIADFNKDRSNSSPVVVYAGNIGEGQSLHQIIPWVARAMPDITFKIIGEGSALPLLVTELSGAGVDNVELEKSKSRIELLEDYGDADVLFLHLNPKSAFLKVLPSKIFEYAATGKPILAGVGGFSSRFLLENVSGIGLFNPCDVEGCVKQLQLLLGGKKIFRRDAFCHQFAREKIIRRMVEDIVELV